MDTLLDTSALDTSRADARARRSAYMIGGTQLSCGPHGVRSLLRPSIGCRSRLSLCAGWPRAQSAMQLASTVAVDRGQLARRTRPGACATGQADEIVRQRWIDGRRILIAAVTPFVCEAIMLGVILAPSAAALSIRISRHCVHRCFPRAASFARAYWSHSGDSLARAYISKCGSGAYLTAYRLLAYLHCELAGLVLLCPCVSGIGRIGGCAVAQRTDGALSVTSDFPFRASENSGCASACSARAYISPIALLGTRKTRPSRANRPQRGAPILASARMLSRLPCLGRETVAASVFDIDALKVTQALRAHLAGIPGTDAALAERRSPARTAPR